METQTTQHYDVVIIGAGLAGLSLARQLLLNSDKTILLLEKRTAIPMALQKYGEATVQLSGYYFSKVLDLEEHLLRDILRLRDVTKHPVGKILYCVFISLDEHRKKFLVAL